ncbi:MAG: branched-chain amino acid ABC transporter permease, partial [Microbacteriaceae bacterium]|nr:branched-chain amino acid ABC transporter permease [Microbacteriaceae bacterium]
MTTPAADGHEPPTMRTAARIAPRIRRFTPASIAGLSVMAALVVLLAVMPYLVPIATSRQLTNLFVYVIIATAWNLLAGFGGMVSIGQQAYIGIGAYGVVVFADNLGLDPLLSIPIVAVVAAIVAIPVSYLAFRLVGGYFAVGTWVVAEVVRLTTIHFPQVGAGSGVSLRAMTQAVPDPDLRTAVGYWAGLVCAVVVVAAVVLLARSRIGLALTAVRDEPTAAATSGVNVVSAKRIVFIVAAAAAGLAGALIAISTLRVQPGGPLGVFSVQWTAFM